MLKKSYPYYLANQPVAANTDLEVLDKYSGTRATRVAFADAAAMRKAIVAAHKARAAMAAFPPDARRDVLEHCVRRFDERREELALALCIEAGKPIKDARGEVTRLVDTFRIAAGEATRIDGEVIELQISERTRGYRGMVSTCRLAPAASSPPSTSHSTWSRTRSRRRSRPVVRSCSSPRRRRRSAH
jgi:acyl-CoA reductase-like NAD-dependent aldehyde dehydrogenase